jgi:hypothetical protein
VVYVGSDANVLALNASNGSKLLSYATGNQSSPAVANGGGLCRLERQQRVRSKRPHHAKMWNHATSGPVESSPVVAKGLFMSARMTAKFTPSA